MTYQEQIYNKETKLKQTLFFSAHSEIQVKFVMLLLYQNI